MTRIAIVLAAGLALAATLPTVPAQAAARDRVFVASYGSDSNPCTFLSPCKTFQQAVNTVAVGGEVTAIDSAGFGPIVISHAITITSPAGVEAGIVPVTGGNSITINANSGDAISLQGLTIDGGGVGVDGIQFTAGASLTIENCVVRNFNSAGIAFLPNANSNLQVSNTLLANNDKGIQVFPSAASFSVVTATLNRVEAINNVTYGIVVNGSNNNTVIQATASESLAANNGVGFIAISPNINTSLNLFHIVATNNTTGTGTGIQAQGSQAAVIISQSMVTTNQFSYQILSGAAIYSAGDNNMFNNGGSTGSLSSFSTQ